MPPTFQRSYSSIVRRSVEIALINRQPCFLGVGNAGSGEVKAKTPDS